jgi:hypothetical protein
MKLLVLTLFCVGLAYLVSADEPLWTEQERLDKRDIVLVGTVLSAEKIANIDKWSDLYLAVVEIEGMKKGTKTASGSRVNVYYEFSVSGRNARCPKYAELKSGDRATFFLRTVTEDIRKVLRIETLKEPALYLEMGSDARKQIAEQGGGAKRP